MIRRFVWRDKRNGIKRGRGHVVDNHGWSMCRLALSMHKRFIREVEEADKVTCKFCLKDVSEERIFLEYLK